MELHVSVVKEMITIVLVHMDSLAVTVNKVTSHFPSGLILPVFVSVLSIFSVVIHISVIFSFKSPACSLKRKQ